MVRSRGITTTEGLRLRLRADPGTSKMASPAINPKFAVKQKVDEIARVKLPITLQNRVLGMPRTGSFHHDLRRERQNDVKTDVVEQSVGWDELDSPIYTPVRRRRSHLDSDEDTDAQVHGVMPRTGSWNDLTSGRRQNDLKSEYVVSPETSDMSRAERKLLTDVEALREELKKAQDEIFKMAKSYCLSATSHGPTTLIPCTSAQGKEESTYPRTGQNLSRASSIGSYEEDSSPASPELTRLLAAFPRGMPRTGSFDNLTQGFRQYDLKSLFLYVDDKNGAHQPNHNGRECTGNSGAVGSSTGPNNSASNILSEAAAAIVVQTVSSEMMGGGNMMNGGEMIGGSMGGMGAIGEMLSGVGMMGGGGGTHIHTHTPDARLDTRTRLNCRVLNMLHGGARMRKRGSRESVRWFGSGGAQSLRRSGSLDSLLLGRRPCGYDAMQTLSLSRAQTRAQMPPHS